MVTGTLVRGIAPPGSNAVAVTREDILATGANSTAQMLQTIPQLNYFNDLLAPQAQGNRIAVNRPSLRGLDSNTAGGTTTLSLLNGHRIVGAGIVSTGVDPAIIPPGALERVEVVPDGGSAIYGSDAVAGVINYITRRKVEGIQVEGRYGIGDDYNQWDVNAALGHSWSTGSAFIAYNYAQHDSIRGRDRDYIRHFPSAQAFATIPGFPAAPTSARGLECSPGNRVELAAAGNYPFSQGQPGRVTDCDYSDDLAFYPSEKRHSVFAGLSQEFGEGIKLDVQGFYSNNKVRFPAGGQLRANRFLWPSLLGPAPAPNFISSPYIFSNFTLSPAQQVYFAWGENQGQQIDVESYGILPTLTADLGSGWQLRVLGSQSWSTTLSRQNTVNAIAGALDNAIVAGLFNPYNPASSDPATLAVLGSGESYGRASQRLSDVRMTIDGDLMKLPGGSVKLAVGAEWYREALNVRKGDTLRGQDTGNADAFVPNTLTADPNDRVLLQPARNLPLARLSRSVKALFGELVIPVFGEQNAAPGFTELTLSAAGRYDHYDDVGGTFNPKFGITYRPVDWLRLRGTWGTSFNAPSLADDPRAEPQSFASISDRFTINFLTPADRQASVGNRAIAVVQGNAPDIKPQEATTFTIGADIEPMQGLKLSATYYNVKFKGQIGFPPLTVPALMWGPLGNLVYVADQGEVSQSLIDQFVAGSQTVAGNCLQVSCTFAILDIRKRNLGRIDLDGLDFNASLAHETSFGSINLGANATYELNRKLVLAPGQPAADLQLENGSASVFRLRTTVGATVGNLSGQFIWSHRSGFDLAAPVSVGLPTEQSKIDAYDLFDLYLRYNLKTRGEGSNFMKSLAFTLSVNNIFDTDPPEYRTFDAFDAAKAGFVNGSTVGRLVQLGVSIGF
ncbi:TonB-dependent receptor [Novosphingobium sp. PS1R-30]|uniref:TonB-dependent receptor n=1 Tax=Novosphingobium anseongense TaxID=3133436 RepID=A0ABU8S2R2_9SPHN